MADQSTDWRINFSDDGMLEAMKALSEQSARFAKSLEDVNKAGETAFDDSEVKDFQASLEKMGKAMVENEKATTRQASALEAVKGKATEAARSINLFGINLGEAAANLKALSASMKASIAGTTGLARAFKVLRVALISTGIGAIVVALGSLVAFLTQTQKGMDAVSKVTTIAGQIFQRAVLAVGSFGEALVKIVQLDFKGAMASAQEGVNGLRDSFREGYEAGNELYNLMIQIREQTRATNNVIAAANREIAKQQNLAENTNKTLGERIQAYDRILDLINVAEAEQLKLAQQQYEQALINAEGNKDNAEALTALDEATRNLIDVEKEWDDRRREYQNARNAALDENAQKLKELGQVLQDFIDDFSPDMTQPATDFIRSFIGGIQDEIAKNPDYIQGILDEAFSDYEVPLRVRPDIDLDGGSGPTAADSLRSQIAAIEQIILEGTTDSLKKLYQARLAELRKALEELLNDLNPEKFIEKFERAIGDMQSTIGNLSDIGETLIGPQLDAQEQYVESLRNSTETLERQLQSQYRLREQGYANDVSALERKLQQENAILQNAEKKRLEMQRKATRQQLLFTALEQAANLALAVAKLASASATNPFTFIATLTAGVSALFAVFSNVKQLAQRETTVPQFREGGPVDGPSHERGGVLAELEGGEYVMSRTAVNAHGDLIEAINDGHLYDYLPNLVASGEKHQAMIAAHGHGQMLKAQREAIAEQTEAIIAYWKSRPIDRPLDQAILREYQVGNMKIKKRFSPGRSGR